MAGRIKGFVLSSRINFVKERFGAEALEKILAALPPADAERLRGVILPSSWFPVEVEERLDEAIIRVIGGRSEEAFRELGRQSAVKNLAKFQTAFLKGKDPLRFLAQTPSIYKIYYDAGSREYQPTGENSGVLITTGAENVTVGDCLTIMGWHEQALEMVGAKGVKITHPVCRARGGTVCRYEVSWT